MRRVAAPAGLSVMLLASCQWLAGYEEFSGGSVMTEHVCAELPARKVVEGRVVVRVDVPAKACLWMDQDEVTVQAYNAWLDGSADAVPWDPHYCSWKERPSDPSRDPSDTCAQEAHGELQPFAANKPIRCVDWCDAEAYCRSTGKRLCYDQSVHGTQVPRGVVREWTFACNNGLDSVFPWGIESDARGRCNLDQAEHLLQVERGVLPVGASPGCASKRGTRDLLGNVAEWTYGCNFSPVKEPAPRGLGCMTKGGGFQDPLQSCVDEVTLPNDTRLPDLGFRCCSELNAEELLEVSATP